MYLRENYVEFIPLSELCRHDIADNGKQVFKKSLDGILIPTLPRCRTD